MGVTASRPRPARRGSGPGRSAAASIAFLLAGAFLPPAEAAEPYLPLKARFYDHDYGAFGNEFASVKVPGCPPDPNAYTLGMLQDSLVFDPAKGKKIPRRGAVDGCSDEIEKWFDPAFSRSATCGNVFFANVGDSARPVWRFDAQGFFPVDSISPQRRFTLPGGAVLANDYAYCMEINAALDYQGGETVKMKGDDDTWLFLDGRLAVDQGGLHYAMEQTVALDTLPILKGKAGRTLDLDLYFCSRTPATAVFSFEAAARLKPLQLKSLQITDTAGRSLSSQDVLFGKTRVCARAHFQSPGEEQCGNYRPPPDLSFLSADWDLNGTKLSIDGGQSCLDLDASTFPDRTRVSLTARSTGLISRIAVTLVRPARPAEGLLVGNGRAERVELRLDPAGGTAPDGLETVFDFAGERRWAWLKPDSARPWTLSGTLDGKNAGPQGATGFAPVRSMTREFLFGRVDTQSVFLRDGVGPALEEAALHWGSRDGQPAWLELRASEPLDGGADSLALALQWKRRDGSGARPGWFAASRERGERLLLSLSAGQADRLGPGDSVSLGPAARDDKGNAAGYHYVPIALPRTLGADEVRLRVRTDPARGKPFVPRDSKGRLIPVDAAGRPLDPSGPDASLAEAGGPILELRVVVPPDRIQLGFHDHLGVFVNEAERAFTESEWEAMRAASPGDTTVMRLLWHPVARSGNRLATGAFIVHGRLWTREGLVKGTDGEVRRMRPASLSIPARLFGFLRE